MELNYPINGQKTQPYIVSNSGIITIVLYYLLFVYCYGSAYLNCNRNDFPIYKGLQKYLKIEPCSGTIRKKFGAPYKGHRKYSLAMSYAFAESEQFGAVLLTGILMATTLAFLYSKNIGNGSEDEIIHMFIIVSIIIVWTGLISLKIFGPEDAILHSVVSLFVLIGTYVNSICILAIYMEWYKENAKIHAMKVILGFMAFFIILLLVNRFFFEKTILKEVSPYILVITEVGYLISYSSFLINLIDMPKIPKGEKCKL